MLYPRGGILTSKSLAERVSRNFSKVRLRKAVVKVPSLKIRKKKVSRRKNEEKIPNSSVINILIKNVVEKTKREKQKIQSEESKSYKLIKEEESNFIGGYGAISKNYGTAPQTPYVDYGKIFGYLGKFKSKSAYENMANHVEALNKSLEDGSFTLIDRETMERGKFYVRYVNSKIPIDKSSLVPIVGMNSSEWEQFKLWMRLDTAIYLLKISTS